MLIICRAYNYYTIVLRYYNFYAKRRQTYKSVFNRSREDLINYGVFNEPTPKFNNSKDDFVVIVIGSVTENAKISN